MKKDIEKALKEFLMDVRITGEERKKGIPIISFVYKEEDKAVLIKALPLPLADIQENNPCGERTPIPGGFFQGRGGEGIIRHTPCSQRICPIFNAP